MMKTGSCLCGGVSYELSGELRPSVSCHCTQCRKTSGHYWSSTQVPEGHLKLTADSTLTWFQSSEKATRGFCNACGASLFWKHDDDNGAISIASGTLDMPTGIRASKHIFTADKGDYYDIADGLPQREN